MVFDLEAHGNRIALIDGDTRFTYSDIARLSKQVSDATGGRKLAFVLCSNCAESIVGYLGLLNGGSVPFLTECDIDAGLLDGLVAHYSPGAIWAPSSMNAQFPQYGKVHSFGTYSLHLKTDASPIELHPDLAALVTTSGSTGTSKLVRLSYENILSNTQAIADYLDIHEDDRAITSLPMSYVYGLSVIQSHLFSGASLVMTSHACYEGRFWKLFKAEECTSFAGVPFMYEMLDKLRFTKKAAPETLKTMTQAGGHLSVGLQEKYTTFAQSNGIRFFVMYGASEATARMGYLPPERALEKIGSAGIAIPGGHFEVVGENGTPLPTGEEGELAYEGPNVSMGYATCASDLAKGDENEGRLLTGDIAKIDAEGFVYITGRKKRFVKILGKRTNLADIEELLKEHFGPLEAVCGGSDDLLRIYLVDPSLTEPIRTYVHEKTGINERMIEIIEVDTIPKSASGKVLYAKLETM